MASLAFVSPAASGQVLPAHHPSSTQAPSPPRPWFGSGGLKFAAPILLCLAKQTRAARLRARATPKEGQDHVPELSKRKRNDPQDITWLDMGTGFTVAHEIPRIRVKSGREAVRERKVVSKVDSTKEPKELISEVAAEVSGMDEAFLTDLVDMTSIQRADVIDELTRKAFMLMEAGEIAEAKEHLQRATRIAEAFERLSQELTVVREQKTRSRSETEVVMELRKELHKEDFSTIFGAQARFARFIGGM